MKDNCQYCKSSSYKRLIWSRRHGKYLCDRCYQRLTRTNVTFNTPSKYGEISYDVFGRPICHICGEGHDKLMAHVRMSHGILAYDYKKKFGLETTKGIMSEKSTNLARLRNQEHYEVAVKTNLMSKGKQTRFKDGCKGRTRDQVSDMTRKKLQLHFGEVKKRGKIDIQ